MVSMDDLFNGRLFDREIIVLCFRWYLRLELSFRDLVEMSAKCGFHWPTRRSCARSSAMFHNLKSAGIASIAALALPGVSRNLREDQSPVDLPRSCGR